VSEVNLTRDERATTMTVTTPALEGTFSIGDRVPDFALPSITGETIRLSDFAGHPVLIFFTTTWCPYCGAEAPYLEQEIWQRYRDQGLQVLSIQVKEGRELAASFAGRYDWTFPVLIDEDGAVSALFAPVKDGLSSEVAIINAHFLLDGDRTVVYRDFLNMERFDARATHVRGVVDEFLGSR
jgi:peroxiredoxin